MSNPEQASIMADPTVISYNSRRKVNVHGPWDWSGPQNPNDWYFDAVTVSDMPGTGEESFKIGDDEWDIIQRFPVTSSAWPQDKCPYTAAAAVRRIGGGTVRARKRQVLKKPSVRRI
ncbi:MAG: hypothetical protein H7338_12340 [Candidatus Sericytochromatia bacterium]|nr:hypothetical protein [Candidatus Sericytochromatia bacterium]